MAENVQFTIQKTQLQCSVHQAVTLGANSNPREFTVSKLCVNVNIYYVPGLNKSQLIYTHIVTP